MTPLLAWNIVDSRDTVPFQSFNRIIITANPSFGVPKEAEFWRHFDRICTRQGWRLFKHSMRKIPADERTMILPAPLSDVAGFIGDLPPEMTDGELPGWFTRKNFDTVAEWERRRWEKPNNPDLIPLGLAKLAWHVDRLFHALRPAGLVVSNKIDHGTALFYWAAEHYGTRRIFFERSPLETFIAEESGMFAESEIWTLFRNAQTRAERHKRDGYAGMSLLVDNPNGFRPQTFADTDGVIAGIARLPGPKFFLPMDNILWTGWAQKDHWQGTVDYYKGTPDPSGAIDALARIAARRGGTLIVKKHPSDIQAYAVTERNIKFVDAPLDALLGISDVCVCFLTKIAFVSVATKKPTVTLAPNTAAASDATFHADRPDDWERAIDEALKATPHEIAARYEKMASLLGWLDRDFYIDGQLPADFGKPSALTLWSKFASSAAGAKAAGSLSAMDRQIDHVMAGFSDRKAWLTAKRDPDRPMTIAVDVSRLANTRIRHSGISRFVQTILNRLDDIPGVSVFPVISRKNMLRTGDFQNDLSKFSDYVGKQVYLLEDMEARASVSDMVYYSPYEELPGQVSSLPRIGTVHDVLHITCAEWYLDQNVSTHIENVLNSFDSDDMVVAVSEYTRMQLLSLSKIAPERVATVYLAADEVFKPADPAAVADFRLRHKLGEKPYFVLFGQFEYRKNVPTTLSAIKYTLDTAETDARFVVVGSAVGAANMYQALSRSGIPEDRFVFLAAPSDAEMAVAYSGATGMLYVSLAEGFGLPVIEAMSCGCPVITSSVTSISEVAGDGALYADPYSVRQISDAILHLERSPSLVEQLRRAALKRAAGFSWDNTAEGIVRVARDALASHAASKMISQDGNDQDGMRGMAPDNTLDLTILNFVSELLLDPAGALQRMEEDEDLGSAIREVLHGEQTNPRLKRHFESALAFAKSGANPADSSRNPHPAAR